MSSILLCRLRKIERETRRLAARVNRENPQIAEPFRVTDYRRPYVLLQYMRGVYGA